MQRCFGTKNDGCVVCLRCCGIAVCAWNGMGRRAAADFYGCVFVSWDDGIQCPVQRGDSTCVL